MQLDPVAKWTIQEDKAQIFHVQVSYDHQFTAVALSDGGIALRSASTGRLSYQLLQSESFFPVTSIRFHPTSNKSFIATSADGLIKEWSTKRPQVTWNLTENDNQIYALDIQNTGNIFATGGRDCKIRVYDYQTKKVIADLSRNEFDLETTRGHCNRIYSLKFHPDDQNILFSGGWDDTLQIWDIRAQGSIRALYGPHICGDALDVSNNTIICGSWRTENQVQMWDLRTYQAISTMKWSPDSEKQQCLIYTCKFVPGTEYFVIGGTGVNQVSSFSSKTKTMVGTPIQTSSQVFNICITNDRSSLVLGTGGGTVAMHAISLG